MLSNCVSSNGFADSVAKHSSPMLPKGFGKDLRLFILLMYIVGCHL
jgi:hypothetical protein